MGVELAGLDWGREEKGRSGGFFFSGGEVDGKAGGGFSMHASSMDKIGLLISVELPCDFLCRSCTFDFEIDVEVSRLLTSLSTPPWIKKPPRVEILHPSKKIQT